MRAVLDPSVEDAVRQTFYIMHHTTPESPHDSRSVVSLWNGLIDAAKFISGWVEHPQLVQDAGKTARDIPFGIRRAFQDYMKAYPGKFQEYPQEYRTVARLCKSIQELREKPAGRASKQGSRSGRGRADDQEDEPEDTEEAMVVDDEGGASSSQAPVTPQAPPAPAADRVLRFKKKPTPAKPVEKRADRVNYFVVA
ncbi:hypothetical protein GALMADRAFT_148832 [Galerina marginata CBS 339.88]|uniref:Uncharacterized protein n=1 Tax=Galerina marginata (strain CBS 339.88) TaxID=685588 RepID=A0A067SER2_GALM3|nr:hypothetical protein GALMADRAFT_148832 [Galerina marginata CBS 339.88]